MPQAPVSDEIAAALARFFLGGAGPSHSKIGNTFAEAGYRADDPYSPQAGQPNKEIRVRTVVMAARRRPDRARALVDALLVQMRVSGCFDPDHGQYDQRNVRTAQRAFARDGWALTDDGVLSPAGAIDLATGGRQALDDHLDRLRRGCGDPGQLLGSAKDLLESVAKFVLEEFGMEVPRNTGFDHLWYLARERLRLLPEQVDQTLPAARNIQAIMQSSWKIAEQVNKLRGLEGTGHGRTLPTGVSADMALLVVREACSAAEYVLVTLDRSTGRAALCRRACGLPVRSLRSRAGVFGRRASHRSPLVRRLVWLPGVVLFLRTGRQGFGFVEPPAERLTVSPGATSVPRAPADGWGRGAGRLGQWTWFLGW